MHATRRLLTHLTMIAATLAAAFLAQAGDPVDPAHGVAAVETAVSADQTVAPSWPARNASL